MAYTKYLCLYARAWCVWSNFLISYTIPMHSNGAGQVRSAKQFTIMTWMSGMKHLGVQSPLILSNTCLCNWASIPKRSKVLSLRYSKKMYFASNWSNQLSNLRHVPLSRTATFSGGLQLSDDLFSIILCLCSYLNHCKIGSFFSLSES